MQNDTIRNNAYSFFMESLTKLHQEYLEKIMRERVIPSATSLARMIKVNPSTLSRLGKEGGQNTLSAPTLDKLYKFSGILPPMVSKPGIDAEIDEVLLVEAVYEILESQNFEARGDILKRNLGIAIDLYKNRIKKQNIINANEFMTSKE